MSISVKMQNMKSLATPPLEIVQKTLNTYILGVIHHRLEVLNSFIQSKFESGSQNIKRWPRDPKAPLWPVGVKSPCCVVLDMVNLYTKF